MQNKKVPLRMCCGCNQMKEKNELVRVVRSPEGEISVDITGKKNGRGAYICKSDKCLKIAMKSRRLEKKLNSPISDEIYEKLDNELR